MTALKREELAELIRDAQSSAPTMPGHPRIRRVMIQGEEYVTAEARPGLPGAERFAHERSLLAVAGRTPLADDPFYVDEEVIVHRVIQGTTLHDILLNSWPVDDEVAVTCGVALATLHGSPTPSLPRATDEQPKLFPLGIQEWANTPDAILAVLVQCGRFQDWELLSGRRRPTRQEGAVLIHSDFKPDNIFLVDSEREEGHVVRLIDWELAGLGFAVEDFAALFAGVTVAAVQSEIPRLEVVGPEAMHRAVQAGTTKTIRFMAAVTRGYRRTRAVDFSSGELVDATALRLLARAQGLALTAGSIGALTTLLIGLTQGLLANRTEAAKAIDLWLGRQDGE